MSCGGFEDRGTAALVVLSRWLTSSRVTISRTWSLSWMAARQSPPRLALPIPTSVPTSPRRSARFSTTRTSSRRCLDSCHLTPVAMLGEASWKRGFGPSADERRATSAGSCRLKRRACAVHWNLRRPFSMPRPVPGQLCVTVGTGMPGFLGCLARAPARPANSIVTASLGHEAGHPL